MDQHPGGGVEGLRGVLSHCMGCARGGVEGDLCVGQCKHQRDEDRS